jgi:hypothetical protein
MCNLGYNLQLVEGGQYLIEVEVERIHNVLWYVWFTIAI